MVAEVQRNPYRRQMRLNWEGDYCQPRIFDSLSDLPSGKMDHSLAFARDEYTVIEELESSGR